MSAAWESGFMAVCFLFGVVAITVGCWISGRHVDDTDPRRPSSPDAWRRDLDRIDADRQAHPERQS